MKRTNKLLLYATLSLLALVSLGPFLWLVSTALKSSTENIFHSPPQLLPQQPTLAHFKAVWQKVPMADYFINSFITTSMAVLFNVGFSVLAAYPLARMQFKGKNTLFLIILATMMIPFQVILLPLYLIVLQLNWVDTAGTWPAYLGLVMPFTVSGFGIFFMRQALINVPIALEESAVMDGCNSWQVFRHVILPLVQPTLATLAVFTFIANWGEFMWPSIVLSKPQLYTLPVGLVHLQGAFSANWRLIAAGTILSTLPVIAFFAVLQRYFISGAYSGAVKG